MKIEFWFEFASTYSYPAVMRIDRLAAARGVAVEWRPFLLGPLFHAQQGMKDSPFNVVPVKGVYGSAYAGDSRYQQVLDGVESVTNRLGRKPRTATPDAKPRGRKPRSTELMPTWSSTSLRLQPDSQGAGQTRPVTSGKLLVECRLRAASSHAPA